MVEFRSINERVASLVIRLNKTPNLHVVQAYAPTSTYDNEVVDVFYEDIELVMNKVRTPYSIIMDDFNAKMGAQQVGKHAVGKFGLGSRSSRAETLVAFAEKSSLLITKIFFRKRKNRKCTWKRRNGESKNEIDFILTGSPSMVRDVQVICGVKTS